MQWNTIYPEFFVTCIFHSWVWNQDFHGWNFTDEGYPNVFAFFAPSLLYKKNLYYYFKWDRQSSLPNSSYITVDVILDLPVAILRNTVVGQSKWAQWHHHAFLLKNNMHMHEMTCNTWPTVVPYFLKPTG